MAEGRVTTAIRFTGDIHARLQKESLRREVSINQLVTWAVERTLPRWEAQDLSDLDAARAVLHGGEAVRHERPSRHVRPRRRGHR